MIAIILSAVMMVTAAQRQTLRLPKTCEPGDTVQLPNGSLWGCVENNTWREFRGLPSLGTCNPGEHFLLIDGTRWVCTATNTFTEYKQVPPPCRKSRQHRKKSKPRQTIWFGGSIENPKEQP